MVLYSPKKPSWLPSTSSQAFFSPPAVRSIRECAFRAFPIVWQYEYKRRSDAGRWAPAPERIPTLWNLPSAPWRCRPVGRGLPVVARRCCSLVRRETGRRKQARRLKFQPPFPINVRPLARGLSRRDLESVSVVIETFDKTVDPSETKRLTNCVFVGNRLY